MDFALHLIAQIAPCGLIAQLHAGFSVGIIKIIHPVAGCHPNSAAFGGQQFTDRLFKEVLRVERFFQLAKNLSRLQFAVIDRASSRTRNSIDGISWLAKISEKPKLLACAAMTAMPCVA